jgi:hypothetical protein
MLINKAIRRVVDDESWFDDEHCINWDGAPTGQRLAALATKRANQLRRRPRQGLSPDAFQLELASKVSACQPRHRCGLAICPHCSTATQRWVTSGIVDLTGQEEPQKVGALSLIPTIPLGSVLTAADLEATMKYVREMLKDNGFVEWAVLCLDISWNDYSAVSQHWPDGQSTSGWCPHVYSHIKTKNLNAFKKRLRAAFTEMWGIPVPVKMRTYDGSAYGASYAFKVEFQRRVSFWNKRDRLDVKDYALPTALNIQAMRALGELGLAGRIDLIGLEINETRTTENKSPAVKKLTSGEE